ncbi:hypothetical protein HGB47_14990 [Leptospira yasudae]|uniref:hypothetical protein n=1 Tax=Leptospira TaxID=171 RepID=UPI001082E370|nr:MULTISPECIES: hypothetical protein [Leptospira]MBW0434923.1 hypothetical protein [Leptospira yasudae]TGM58549.1 hypothetical protein EHQ97_05480 [Leptospira adleri]
MKVKILNVISIVSFAAGLLVMVLLTVQILNTGYGFSIKYINLDSSSKIATITQGIAGTIWIVTTISLLFLTYEIQKKELSDTSASIRQQNEDSHFFNLLNSFTNIRNQVELSINYYSSLSSLETGEFKEEKYKGNKYFQYIFIWYMMLSEAIDPRIEDLERVKKHRQALNTIFNIPDEKFDYLKKNAIIAEEWTFYGYSFTAYFALISSEMLNYFNFFKQMYKYSQRCISNELYIEYIRSVLSSNELSLLFYYGLNDDELRKMLRESKFFESISPSLLIKKGHIEFYR